MPEKLSLVLILSFSLILWLLGLGVSYAFDLSLENAGLTELVDFKDAQLRGVLLTAAFLVLSVAFYGKGAMPAFLLLGLFSGNDLQEAKTLWGAAKPLIGAIQLFISSYSGVMLGLAAKKDLEGESNVRIYFKSVLVLFALALAISLVSGWLVSFAPK